MMPIEHQVCSHELATRLAELGVRQESVFWWVDRKLTYTGGRASHAPLHGGIAAFTNLFIVPPSNQPPSSYPCIGTQFNLVANGPGLTGATSAGFYVF